MRARLSILDLAPIGRGQTARESFAASVALAQRAEELGYLRVWYAEHHNMPSIASSATSVLIAHIGAQTSSIRLGSGGIMLPNHSPLTIAEQFGTLEAMYPGRIDLGLGRAPGSDQKTTYALRRDPRAAEAFPRDVLELQAYLAGDSRVPGVDAIPGQGSAVPLYILGSSLFGAQLAGAYGLPYAFASHFAPVALHQAILIDDQRMFGVIVAMSLEELRGMYPAPGWDVKSSIAGTTRFLDSASRTISRASKSFGWLPGSRARSSIRRSITLSNSPSVRCATPERDSPASHFGQPSMSKIFGRISTW